MAGAGIRLRGHHGDRRSAGGTGDVPLRDELPGPGSHHGRRRSGTTGSAALPAWAARTPRPCTCSCPTGSTSTASGPGRPARRSLPSPRTSSTATAPTGPSTSRATAGRSPTKVRDVSKAEAEAALGQPIAAHQLGVSDPAERLDDTLAALADPVRRRAVELLARAPPPGRRAGRGARRRRARHEQAPAGAARSAGIVTESSPDFDARVRIYSLRSGTDGRPAVLVGHGRTGLGPAAGRLRRACRASER